MSALKRFPELPLRLQRAQLGLSWRFGVADTRSVSQLQVQTNFVLFVLVMDMLRNCVRQANDLIVVVVSFVVVMDCLRNSV